MHKEKCRYDDFKNVSSLNIFWQTEFWKQLFFFSCLFCASEQQRNAKKDKRISKKWASSSLKFNDWYKKWNILCLLNFLHLKVWLKLLYKSSLELHSFIDRECRTKLHSVLSNIECKVENNFSKLKFRLKNFPMLLLLLFSAFYNNSRHFP